MKPAPRSWLFVPGDSERKLEKSLVSDADALIFDLEDAVRPERKATAREMVAEHLAARANRAGPQYWVRINPVDSGLAEADLESIVPMAPGGIVLPKASGPSDVARVARRLDALGAAATMAILPVVTETARAALTLHRYVEDEPQRLFGMTWGAEDLSAEVGAAGNRDEDGRFSFTYRMVRSHCLLAATALGIAPIDTVYTDFRDLEGLGEDSARSYREGFSGRLAIHPAQVAVINASYTPDEETIAQARRIEAAFLADPEAGAVSLDGRMLDRPHLVQARKILAAARRYADD